MKKSSVLFIVFCLGFSVRHFAQSEYTSAIEASRKAKNEELRSKKTSPLQKEDRKAFHDLDYFPVDENWRKTVRFRTSPTLEEIEIPTSAGTTKTFQAYGLMEIEDGDNHFSITAYKRVWPNGVNPYPNEEESLFVPFKDLTTGESTYGGGRYLDIPVPKGDGEIELDFNACYNPYCAYGTGFSCPIPPKHNFIKTEVKAGEKSYSH
jgi:uncharacterized protein